MAVVDQPASYLIEGEEVTIPVEVRSAKMVAAQYLVDVAAAQRLVEPTGLRVARQPGGKAVCALSAVTYADNDLGPYNELAVAFVVEPHDAPPGARQPVRQPTTYLHRLPVNQVFTCAVGRELWGFPKWVCDIAYDDLGDRTRCVVVDDGALLLSLEAKRGLLPLPAADMTMTSYSFDDAGVLRRTVWTTRNQGMRACPGGTRLQLGPDHPVADELRSLGLPKRPLMTATTGLMTASFGAPEVVEL